MDKEALLEALDNRREVLTETLRAIGSSEKEAVETMWLQIHNQGSEQSQTLEEYRNDLRAAIRGQLHENAYTCSFVDRGLWVDTR